MLGAWRCWLDGKLFAPHEKPIFFSLACFKLASHGARRYEPSSQALSAPCIPSSSVLCFLTAASCQAALQAQQLEKWDVKRRVLIVVRRISNLWLQQKNLQMLNRPLLVDRSLPSVLLHRHS